MRRATRLLLRASTVVAQSLHIVSTGPSMTTYVTTVVPLHVDWASPESLSLPIPIHWAKGTNYLADIVICTSTDALWSPPLSNHLNSRLPFFSQTLESWTQSDFATVG